MPLNPTRRLGRGGVWFFVRRRRGGWTLPSRIRGTQARPRYITSTTFFVIFPDFPTLALLRVGLVISRGYCRFSPRCSVHRASREAYHIARLPPLCHTLSHSSASTQSESGGQEIFPETGEQEELFFLTIINHYSLTIDNHFGKLWRP